MQKTGAEILWECLEQEGVDRVFGYPGGAILPAYDAMTRYPSIHHVLSRHEQGATHMADGYARATGQVGVVLATSGPGATNLVTGLGTALMDSSPIVCITGQVPTQVMGSDAFQETDITGITLPVTKHNYLVHRVEDLAFTLREAFQVAKSGRPGPVLVDIPKDVQLAKTEYEPSKAPVRLPGRPRPVPSPEALARAQELLDSAERPLILAGHGIVLSGAAEELRQFVERTQTPVALTLLGKGALSEEHPLCLGMMGMHGAASVNRAIQRADLLLALGMRFDDRVTGKLETYAPGARKIHVDIDPAELQKNVRAEVGIAADVADVLRQWLAQQPSRKSRNWLEEIRAWQEEEHDRDILRRAGEGPELHTAEVMDALHRHTGGDGINVTDVGQHQMWEAQYFPHRRPGTLITSGGMGTMGFGLPAAIGAKMGRPDEEVWAIVGDGGFQMTQAEIATAAQEGVEVKIAVINNGYLGMVRQWQEFFYEERYHATPMLSPDFCALAAAYGIPSQRVHRRDQMAKAIEGARAHQGGPVLLEFVVEQMDVVYPMVPAGADLDTMIRRPEHPAPLAVAGGGAR